MSVYFIKADICGLIKIGRATNVFGRLSALRIGSPEPLSLAAFIDGAANEERALHARFDHLHSHGEWFKPGPDLLNYLSSLPKAPATAKEHGDNLWRDKAAKAGAGGTIAIKGFTDLARSARGIVERIDIVHAADVALIDAKGRTSLRDGVFMMGDALTELGRAE